jgi:hypothetical protein
MMASSINPGPLRRAFGRDKWFAPQEYGTDGWQMLRKDYGSGIIVSVNRFEDGIEWAHASIARSTELPSYEDLVTLRTAVWGEEGWAFQVFAPPGDHISIHPFTLHLWGRLDGARIHPNFGVNGTI